MATSDPIRNVAQGGASRFSYLRILLNHLACFCTWVTAGGLIFARDSIYAIARICYRNSGRPDGRLSVTRVDQSKTVEVRIMQLTPQGSPMTLVFPC